MGWVRRVLTVLRLCPRRVSVVILGLDNSGKSTLVSCLRARDLDCKNANQKYDCNVDSNSIAPTVGFKVSTVELGPLRVSVLDMSGQQRYRKLWECYYQDVQGVVFVVDAADVSRLAEARDALATVTSDEDLKRVPLLIFANKMDLGHALNMPEIAKRMRLTALENSGRSWNIAACSAKTGEGLDDGLDWLLEQLKRAL